MNKYKINQHHCGWLLSVVMVKKDGHLVASSVYQHTSSIEMKKLYDERQEWHSNESNKSYGFITHFCLIQILTFPLNKSFISNDKVHEDELNFYAQEEQKLIDSNKP